MKRLWTIFRTAVISLECLILLGGWAVFVFWPAWLVWLSGAIGQQAEVLKYGGLLPAGLVVYDSKVLKAMLLPKADKGAILQGWGRYWDLKCSGTVGLVYGVVFALGGVASLLFDWKTPSAYQSGLLVTSVAGALATSATLYFASIRVEEMFRTHAPPKASE
jgi:hypothetical protein